tara:strand:+ start:10763 stop:11941 length:1179 start_codon:yes stop_codon:yes gene_type:complete
MEKSNGLDQGLQMISERINSIFSLKDNIEHEKDNIIEGNVGNMDNMPSDCSTLDEPEEKMNCLKRQYENKANKYQNELLPVYKTKYTKFLGDYSNVSDAVNKCKLSCMQEPKYQVSREELGESRTSDRSKLTIAKKKNGAKRACKIGCHFNLPQILECEDEFKTSETDTGSITKGMTCSDISQLDDYQTIYGTDKMNERATLLSVTDTKNKNALDHCCSYKLNEKYVPYRYLDGSKYTSCSQLPIDQERTGDLDLQTACNNGKNTLYNTPEGIPNNSPNYFMSTYDNIVKTNEDLQTTSKDIMDLVSELKTLGVDLIKSKKEKNMEFRNENEKYEELINDVKEEGNKTKILTLNKQVEDKYLQTQSVNMRMYVWSALALGFGVSALLKIQSL